MIPTAVELDIFSGRPNPRWLLRHGDDGLLREVHQRLAPAIGPAPEPPGLGYRGFTYKLDGTPWRAYRGYISTRGLTLRNPGEEIERFLLARMPTEYKAVAERVRAAIDTASE